MSRVEEQPISYNPDEEIAWPIGKNSEGKSVFLIAPVLPEERDVNRRTFIKGLAYTSAGLAAIYAAGDGMLGWVLTKRAFREVDKLIKRKQGVEASTPIAENSTVISLENGVVSISNSQNIQPAIDLVLPDMKQGIDISMVVYVNTNTNGDSYLIPILNSELNKIIVSPEKNLPLPSSINYTRWDGSTDDLTVPLEYWQMLLQSYEVTGTNPYLLAALADTESNWSLKIIYSAKGNSSAGAGGMFQFMPTTWPKYAVSKTDRFDPIASAIAAGKMVSSIGLAKKFENAKTALAAGDNNAYTKWRLAFINNFTGADGSPCWNKHSGQAAAVFDGAMKLVIASAGQNK